MSNLFEKLIGKKKSVEVPNTNQNVHQPEQPITFNQNVNIDNQQVNPLGFQPTSQYQTLNVIPSSNQMQNMINNNQNNENNKNM